MKKALLTSIAALLLATGAYAEDRLAPDYFDPPECKQFTHEEFRACINRMWAAHPEPQFYPGEWKPEKWNCAFHWTPRYDRKSNTYDENDFPIIDLEDLAKLRKKFQTKEMKAHCAWLQCLADRGAGKVKHCYLNDKRWR